MRTRKRRGLALLAAVSAIVGAVQILPASALPLFTISGTVRDATGRVLPGATVNDGNQTATTGIDGKYTLTEEATGTYDLVARRTDTEPSAPQRVNATLPLPVTGVDFTLIYIANPTLVQPFVSTANGPATRTYTVNTTAPSPGTPGTTGGASCVYVTDSRTGLTTSATHATTTGSFNLWTWTLSLDQATPEASHTLSHTVKDCATGTTIGKAGSKTYTVDNTAPDVIGGRIFPLSGSQTQFTSQPLSAKVSDRNGTTGMSATFSLTNTTTGVTTTHSGSASGPSYVASSSLSLLSGNNYRVAVTVTDAAGNSASAAQDQVATGGGFLVTPITNLATTARVGAYVPQAPCEVGTLNTQTLTRTVTCKNIVVHADSVPVTMAAVKHGGESQLTQTFSVSSLRVQPTTAGQAVNSDIKPLTGNRSIKQGFRVEEASSIPVTVNTDANTLGLPDITLTLSGTTATATDGAFVEMLPVTASAVTPACANPASSSLLCTPDPLPPVTSDMTIKDWVAVPGQSIMVSLNDGGVGAYLPIGSTVKTDNTATSWGIQSRPPEPISQENLDVARAVFAETNMGRTAAICLPRIAVTESATVDNAPIRAIESGLRGPELETTMAGCSGGSVDPPPPPDFEENDRYYMQACFYDRDGQRNKAQPGERRGEFRIYYQYGCYNRNDLGRDETQHAMGDHSSNHAQTCSYNDNQSCDGWNKYLNTVTTAHTYANGVVQDPNPSGRVAFANSCHESSSSTTWSFTLNGLGVSKTFGQSRTECSEYAEPTEISAGVFGVNWVGESPHTGLRGARRSSGGNVVYIKNREASAFTYRMSAAFD